MNYKRTQKHRTTFPKSYLTIPVFLGVLALTGQVSADETEVLVVEEPRTQVEPVAVEVVEPQEATEESTPLETEEVVVETPVATEDSVEEVVTEQATDEEIKSTEQTETVTETPTVEPKLDRSLAHAVPEVAEETSTEVSVENADQTPVLGVTDSGEVVDTYLAGASSSSLVTYQVSSKGVTIRYEGKIPENSQILYAVWSDKNDQDDLKWYVSDAVGAAYVEFKNHKDYGRYHLHTYARTNGKMKVLGNHSFERETPEFESLKVKTAEIYENHRNDFPQWLWKGASPIKYSGERTEVLAYDENYKVSNKGVAQEFLNLLTELRTLNGIETKNIKITDAAMNYAQFRINELGERYNLSHRTNNLYAKNGAVRISENLNTSPNGLGVTVRSDRELAYYLLLHWYGEYFNIQPTYGHSHTLFAFDNVELGMSVGYYNTSLELISKNPKTVHTTAKLETKKVSNTLYEYHINWKPAVFLPKITFDYQVPIVKSTEGVKQPDVVPAPVPKQKLVSGDVTVSPVNQTTGSFTTTIKNVSSTEDIKTIRVAVWSHKNDQDDLTWQTAIRQQDGSYQVTSKLSDHKNDTGLYHIHVYYDLAKSGMKVVSNNTLTVSEPTKPTTPAQPTAPQKLVNGDVTVSPVNQSTGSFTTTIKNVSSTEDIKAIRVAVWSHKNDQDDLTWQIATRQQDGSYQVTTKLSDHKNDTGLYHIHVYYDLAKSGMKVVSNNTLTVKESDVPKQSVTLSTHYRGTGVYQVRLNNISTSGDIHYAVWSHNKDQDDLKWYKAEQTGTVATGLFNVNNHKDTGLYHVHAYQKQNGKMVFLAKQEINVAKQNFLDMPYYNQGDNRWAYNWYGNWNMWASGCVPTSLAMIYSALTDKVYTPTELASYLYNNTTEFNKTSGVGTTGRGILVASQAYGLNTEVLQSYDSLANALKEGHYVAAAVNPSKFVISGTHELVLKGYNAGKTYVTDPANRSNNGWYDISYIWRNRSTDPVDTRGLGQPFVKITDKL